MSIKKNSVVSISYVLTNDAGKQLDASPKDEPLTYLHGAGNIIRGLETALEGQTKGEKMKISVPPEEAYGLRDEALVQSIPRDRFPDASEVKIGAQFQASTENGPVLLTVTDIRDNQVTVDANHPLAGSTLHFNVEIVEIREATAEELQHGHVHGPDGHHH
ncbi:MAG: peptidylprolyl isomerase [Bdellovibrionaceae bacterium]|nr:peptidylprolyl isomerase [Pseudobdellovibrionaceae bacterium]